MKKIAILFFALVISIGSFAQDKKFGIEFHGFVKNDFIFDSRQTVSPREGHFMLWPAPILEDLNGDDINARPNTNLLAIQSRLSGKITGPDAFGAKTSGVIEGDFFGSTNADINLLRLRHAYLKLKWEKSELLMGQYWNPLFVTACFPSTVSFNTGAPIQPFSRNPQIRFTRSLTDGINIMAAALSQRDYVTQGPAGGSSSYLRNSAIPDMHLQLHYTRVNEEKGRKCTMGIGGATKSVVPLTQQNNLKADLSVRSYSAIAFANIKAKKITVKFAGIYGENLSDVLSITGFAVKEWADSANTIVGAYTPTTSAIFWTDIHSNGKKWQWGIFAGMNKYLGTREEMSSGSNPVYSLVQTVGKNDITMMYRVSPRIVFNSGKARLAAEIEYTYAEFGATDPNAKIERDPHGIPMFTAGVANIRFLIGAYYFF